MRINRFLALCGVGSRRKADNLIKEGRVTVNGEIATLATRVDDGDVVEVDGKPVSPPSNFVYIKFNKPRGIVTAMSSPYGEKLVSDFLKEIEERVFPVGRLDKDVEGILLFTNDGELAHRLLHPSFGVEKEYVALLEKPLRASQLRRLERGVTEGGEVLRAKKVTYEDNSRKLVKVVMTEGKKREVKRLFRAVGNRVVLLKRVSFAGIRLDIAPGRWKFLTEEETKSLLKITGLTRPAVRTKGSNL